MYTNGRGCQTRFSDVCLSRWSLPRNSGASLALLGWKGALLAGVFHIPLGAKRIERAHDFEGFIERHHGAFGAPIA